MYLTSVWDEGRVNAVEIPNITVTLLPLSKRNHPIALDITLIVYHPDLLHSNKPESLRTKFFLNKMSQPSLCGGGAPNNDPASSACPWTPWSFHIPEFSLWHSGVCPCGCVLNLKESQWATRDRKSNFVSPRSAASPGSARASSLYQVNLSIFICKCLCITSLHGLRKDSRGNGPNGFTIKGACKPRYSWCLLPRKVQTWTFPDLRKFRKPKAFPRLAFKVPLPRQKPF